jgi:hypothetical protein
MQTKLTLRLDDALIEHAKAYAKAQGRSVSQIVADYLRLLAEENAASPTQPLPEKTRSLKGLLAGSGLSKEDRREHQQRKHLA